MRPSGMSERDMRNASMVINIVGGSWRRAVCISATWPRSDRWPVAPIWWRPRVSARKFFIRVHTFRRLGRMVAPWPLRERFTLREYISPRITTTWSGSRIVNCMAIMAWCPRSRGWIGRLYLIRIGQMRPFACNIIRVLIIVTTSNWRRRDLNTRWVLLVA